MRGFAHDPLHLTRGPYPFRIEHARAFWSAARCPVLLVEGSESGTPPEDMPSRLAAFRDGKHLVIPGAGHALMRRKPREVASAVAELFVGSAPDETLSSKALGERRWTRLGVGAMYASSKKYGPGRLWVLILYGN